ncbi:hypothetical protein M758_11G008700 [Ceratodon purpureus]|uniref:Uncharacterized protein n=1 Tax=Ceratodon purpureus TaxID=3225 RepID=A0A8T0G9V4_CERPU|nr:hypothetical protein KC19_11G010300 [Ceratodon purpureus]KAG0600119.1 hypothetical protein M758_11G008700 [Ceratodon purpureus]
MKITESLVLSVLHFLSQIILLQKPSEPQERKKESSIRSSTHVDIQAHHSSSGQTSSTKA